MEWKHFWNELLEGQKLRQKVLEMDMVDQQKGHTTNTEEICHLIYNDYIIWKNECEKVKDELWKIIEKFPGVHLHTSRIKTIDSLIEKVVRKRYERLGDDTSEYANISVENYRDIITDLVGLRLIINYRGHWLDMHHKILEEFPYDSKRKYEIGKLLMHVSGEQFQAEIPKAYYADGDDIKRYLDNGLIPKKHKMNYRSIHYTISFHGVYIEIQIRTIYDEAWSDCDHNYVYKKDDNKSHTALEQISGILAQLTNLANDIGEEMKDIYDSQAITEKPGVGWNASEDVIRQFEQMEKRLEEAGILFREFKNRLIVIK